MPSAPEGWASYGAVDRLPSDALALLGQDFFSTPGWYRTVEQTGLPAGARPEFVVVAPHGRPGAVFPMLVAGRRAASLTTPYTCQWQPLIRPGLDDAAQQAVWRGLASWCRRFGQVRLDAMDDAVAARIAAGLRALPRGAPVPLGFDHFGNWHGAAPDGWPAYLARLPGQLRETIRRRNRRLMQAGGALRIFTGPDEIADGIGAFEAVYARSWKTPEPYPDFQPSMLRACAQDGSLRLGVLSLGRDILAAQIWVVRGGWAAVLKLAHDEAASAHSPGTVLTAQMIEHVVTRDGVTALDFGRGDDAYKAQWVDKRRQRVGLVLANMRRLDGVAAAVRHGAGRLRKAGGMSHPPRPPA
jgi:hypothetical protein